MKRRRKNNLYLVLLILLLVITLGYAYISTTLKINGEAQVTKQTWSVYWDTPVVSAGSVTDTVPTRSSDGSQANVKLTWTIDLSVPGDYYEFTVDAVNNGSIDAMITNISKSTTPTLPSYIKYDVTYADGIDIEEYHLLSKATNNTPTKVKYKVRVYYDPTNITGEIINAIPTGGNTYTFKFEATYGMATDDAIPRPVWILPQGKTANTLVLGDELCTNGECFNFVRYDGDDVVLLSKYGLKVGRVMGTIDSTDDEEEPTLVHEYTSNEEGYGKQYNLIGRCQSDPSYPAYEYVCYGQVDFATDQYYLDNNTLKPEYGDSYPADIYNNTYISPPGDANYSIAYYVENYKTFLVSNGVIIKEVRLLTYSEATTVFGCPAPSSSPTTCPLTSNTSFLANLSFATGTAAAYRRHEVYSISQNGKLYNWGWTYPVRPIIVIEKSKLN